MHFAHTHTHIHTILLLLLLLCFSFAAGEQIFIFISKRRSVLLSTHTRAAHKKSEEEEDVHRYVYNTTRILHTVIMAQQSRDTWYNIETN